MAAKFWVGGTGNLDGVDTTHISDTSGGAGGATYPVAGDTLTFDAASGGGTVTFTAALSIATLTTGAHTGTIDTNGQTVTVSGTWNLSGTGTRTLTLGASAISVGTWTATVTTNLTFNANTSTITQTGATQFDGGGLTYATAILSGAANVRLNGANTFGTLTRTGTAVKTDLFVLLANQTVSGTFTVNGNSSVNRVFVSSNTKGTARTITAATVTITNADFQDITGAGAGSWNLSAISGLSGDCGGNSGITFTSPVTNYWIGGTGNWDAVAEWASSSGGASSSGRVPLPQDSAVFDANSFSAGSQTVTQNMTRIGSVDWTGVTNTPTFSTSTACSVFGSLTLISAMVVSAQTAMYTFEGRGSNTFYSAGNSWSKPFTIDCATGSVTLGDAFSSAIGGNFFHLSGTFTTGNFSVSCYTFQSTGTNTRTLNLGSSVISLSLTTGNAWNMATSGLTLNSGTSTIKLAGAMIGTLTFTGGGFTYYNLEINTTGAFNHNIANSNTFNNIHINASVAARTVLFTAGTTTTVSGFTRDAGTNVITIGSITAANHNLVKSGGTYPTITLDYLSISRSQATPGTLTWYAGDNSTDGGNNSGWIFDPGPQYVSTTTASSIWTGVAATASSIFYAASTAARADWAANSQSANSIFYATASVASALWAGFSHAASSVFHAAATAASALWTGVTQSAAPPDSRHIAITVSVQANPDIVVSRSTYSITVS